MRLIDADALEKEGWSLHRTIRVDKNTSEYQTKPLKQVPTIEPERKKGEWTVKEGELLSLDECSVCRKIVIHRAPQYNFCPHCGADMRGDDHDL